MSDSDVAGALNNAEGGEIMEYIALIAVVTERKAHEINGTLRFGDMAAHSADFFGPNDYVGFKTMLVGVKADGSFVSWANLGTNFQWKSNAAFDGTGGVFGYLAERRLLPLPPSAAGTVIESAFRRAILDPIGA